VDALEASLRVPYSWRWNFLRRFSDGAIAARSMGVTVGRRTRIYSGEFGTEPWLIDIGDDVTISIGVAFLPHDGAYALCADEHGRRYRYSKIVVGAGSFIGARAVLLPGVVVGRGCIVAAGSVVTKSVPAGYVVGGNPARILMSSAEFISKAASEPTDRSMVGRSRHERIDSIVREEPRPFLPEA
jgi:acetyltransferase-like isoleucine patch superfamily enzyme